MKIPALIMLGPPGENEIEYWLAEAKRSAAMDLIQRLQNVDAVGAVHVYTADAGFAAPLEKLGALIQEDTSADFHFGRSLRTCIEAISDDTGCLAYFGAASAPLLSDVWLARIVDHVLGAERPCACVNNYYSTDWAVLNYTSLIAAADEHIPTDNSIGWVAKNLCGFSINTLVPCAASRNDLDTPSDLMMIADHPGIGPYLRTWLESNSAVDLTAARRIRSLLETNARTLALLGRVSSDTAIRLEKATQIWTRIYSEERGMTASGRLARGEVMSLLGKAFADWGPKRFVHELEELSDGVVWDTRVVMAQLFGWPSASDRYAFDLGRGDMLQNRALAEWCEAVHSSSIPILTGGHNVVSGGLLSLLETVFPDMIPEFEIKPGL